MKAQDVQLQHYYTLYNKNRTVFKVVGCDLSTGSILGKVNDGQFSATIKIPLDCEIEEVKDTKK